MLACKWRNCGREFTEKKYLVDHVTSSHIEQRKGCDDFPCFWEVTNHTALCPNWQMASMTNMKNNWQIGALNYTDFWADFSHKLV